MLEILLLVFLSKQIAATLRKKGRNPTGYVILFVLLWIFGEVSGFIIGGVVMAARNPRNAFNADGPDLLSYGFALAGAAVGGTIGFVIPIAMPPVERDDDDYDDEDDEDRRRRRRRRRDEDEDRDRKRVRRRDHDDDEDDEDDERERKRSPRRKPDDEGVEDRSRRSRERRRED